METNKLKNAWACLKTRLPLKFRWTALGIAAAAGAVLLLTSKSGEATPSAPASTVPSVAVVKVTREDLAKEMKIPAEFRPYTEVELYAKVSGYLQEIKVDFGDQVKAGQLLATIEVPELHSDLDNALATERKAEADYTNAHLAYTRLLAVDKEHANLVAQQDLDAAASRDANTAAAIAAAKATVEKLQTMMAYTKITAPFDGVITRRYADPGDMILAGTAQAKPLVRVSNNYRLRLDFPVSVDYVRDVRLGDAVTVRIDSLGGKTLSGKIARFTHQVDESTRTMLAETEMDNPKLELVPGMYATVVLQVQQRPQALAIPTEAISAGQRDRVYVVNASHEIEERAVTLGLETPTKYEVLSGLKEGELALVGSTGQLRPGQKVESKLVSLATKP